MHTFLLIEHVYGSNYWLNTGSFLPLYSDNVGGERPSLPKKGEMFKCTGSLPTAETKTSLSLPTAQEITPLPPPALLQDYRLTIQCNPREYAYISRVRAVTSAIFKDNKVGFGAFATGHTGGPCQPHHRSKTRTILSTPRAKTSCSSFELPPLTTPRISAGSTVSRGAGCERNPKQPSRTTAARPTLRDTPLSWNSFDLKVPYLIDLDRWPGVHRTRRHAAPGMKGSTFP